MFLITGWLLLPISKGARHGSVLDALPASIIPPDWVIWMLIILGSAGFIGMAYFELIKPKQRFICSSCGKEQLIPTPARAFPMAIILGSSICALLLIGALVLTLALSQ